MINKVEIDGKKYLKLKVNPKKVVGFGLDYDGDIYRNRYICFYEIYTNGILDYIKYWFMINRDYIRVKRAQKKYRKKHEEDMAKYLSVSLSKTNDC